MPLHPRRSRSSSFRAASLALSVFALAACRRESPPEPSNEAHAPPATSANAASANGAPLLPLAPSGQLRIIHAQANGGDAAAIIRARVDEATREKSSVIVYVGAHWCEPCERFREAAEQGKLDALLPNVTLLHFDLDADRDPLEKAGYTGKFIPLFIVPKRDGTASDARMEGSVKGDGAVADIVPRLRAILDRAAR